MIFQKLIHVIFLNIIIKEKSIEEIEDFLTHYVSDAYPLYYTMPTDY